MINPAIQHPTQSDNLMKNTTRRGIMSIQMQVVPNNTKSWSYKPLQRISSTSPIMAVNIVMSIAWDGHNDSEDKHYDRM